MTAWTCEPRAPRAVDARLRLHRLATPNGPSLALEFAIVDEDDVLVLVVAEAELIPTDD
jgi:hypothetical protein